jgi:hypothetical protein
LALRAKSTIQAIMGLPAMSASGLPGKRVDAMRAGITTTGFIAASHAVRRFAAQGHTCRDVFAGPSWRAAQRRP